MRWENIDSAPHFGRGISGACALVLLGLATSGGAANAGEATPQPPDRLEATVGAANRAGDSSPDQIQVQLDKHRFSLPAGFTVERVAGPPFVDRPIVADFDEDGRLYVADSSGSNAPPTEQLKAPDHRIVRLEDLDGDGRFDRQTVFADRVMFPEGALWYQGSLYVSAPPSIWKYTDRDGDGAADERVEWFRGGTLTGCANDLHGPYLGRDGRIYWCKGAFAQQQYDLPGRPGWTTRAAHIFRSRPDGSGIEPVMSGGMDNPVDVVFTPAGERIFSTTFLQQPGGGKRDGLIHAIYGGVWGKDHDVLHNQVRTGPDLMPVLAHLGAAAPCGLTTYDSGAFGPKYADNLFVCEFNLHQVARVELSPSGGTLAAEVTDFLRSDHIDFHPTDVIEDADGSLLVIDTGGWYKLCCPTSQLDKPDVLGAIYRLRRPGTELSDPRGRKLDWDLLTTADLGQLLGDPRPAVQRRAIDLLGRGGDRSLIAILRTLESDASTLARRNAVWAATRHEDGATAVRRALDDVDESVRQAAAHSAGLRRDRGALARLSQLILAGESMPLRRAAAEAIGRIGDLDSVPTLLNAIEREPDGALEHSIIYALIEIGHISPQGVARSLEPACDGDRTNVTRAALTALDQLGNSTLRAEPVIRQLRSPDESLRATAWWIVGRHPEWGAGVAALVRERLLAGPAEVELESLIRDAATLAPAREIQEMLAGLLSDGSMPPAVVSAALRIVVQARLKDSPPCWVSAFETMLSRTVAADDEPTLAVLDCLRSRNLPSETTPGLLQAVARIAADRRRSESVRVFALARTPGQAVGLDSALLDLMIQSLSGDRPPAQRAAASELLARARLNDRQLMELAGAMRSVGPLELDRLLPAFQQSTATQVGQSLIEALRANPSRESARIDLLEPLLKAFTELTDESQTLLAELNQGAEERREELERLMNDLSAGDIRRGQAVFHSTKAACYSCHAIGYNGGTVGPDLTQIGKIRNERDLLESILYPSASLVRSYEPVTVVGTDGRTHNGLIRSDRDGELVLATGPNQEVRLERSQVEEIHASKISVMPAGLDKQLSREELADLIAFLRSRN